MDELHRDVRVLHTKSRDMDWLFCFNNPLALKIMPVSFPIDSKVPKDMFEGRKDPRAHIIQYNDYMNVLEASDTAKYKAFSTMLKASVKDWYLSLSKAQFATSHNWGKCSWKGLGPIK